MRALIIFFSIYLSGFSFAQVGINTTNPKATLDVVGKPTDLTLTDGFIAPRLKGSELKVKDSKYTSDQTGAIVYVTEALAPADTTAKTVNVTATGYFYFDGAVWQKFNSASGSSSITADNGLTKTTDNIQLGGDLTKSTAIGTSAINTLKITGLQSSSGAENNVVIDLFTGTLKYSPTVAEPLFHAKLAANQTSLTGTATIFLGAPEATSSLYSYNTSTGIMTFNVAGNYLVMMQMSFRNVAANDQLIIGMCQSDNTFISRGSTRVATTIPASATVGQIHQYNTVISVTAGQQLHFAARSANTYALLKDESGTTGTGNVSNITIIKL